MAKETNKEAPATQVGSLANISLADLSLDTKLNPRIYNESEPEENLRKFGESILDDSAAIYNLKFGKNQSNIRTIVYPIVVRKGGTYKVFEGRRRITGLKLAIPEADHARAHVLVDVIDGEDPAALARLAIHGNTHREQLSHVEIAVFGHTRVRELLSTEKGEASDKEVAQFLDIPYQSWANLYKPLAEAPPKLRTLIHNKILGLNAFTSIRTQLADDPQLADMFADALANKAKEKKEQAEKAPAKKAATKGTKGERSSKGTKVPPPSGSGKSSKPVVSGAEAVNILKGVRESKGSAPTTTTKQAQKIEAGVQGSSGASKLKALLTELVTDTQGVSGLVSDYSSIFSSLLSFLDGNSDKKSVKSDLMNAVKISE